MDRKESIYVYLCVRVFIYRIYEPLRKYRTTDVLSRWYLMSDNVSWELLHDLELLQSVDQASYI